MKMEERGHTPLFSFDLSVDENVEAMAGALAAILSHEVTDVENGNYTCKNKQATNQTKSLGSPETMKYNLARK